MTERLNAMKSFKNKIRFYLFFWWIALAWPLVAAGQNLQYSGYAKYLFSVGKYPFLKQRLSDHLLHVRLNSRYYFSDRWNAALEARLRFYYGSSVEKIPNFKSEIKHHYSLRNLGLEFLSTANHLGYAEIDRAYLDYQGDFTEVTIGRQRIPWGTSLVWNVIDLFNPLSFLDFDYEEHPGADALRAQYFTGPVSHLEWVVAPHPRLNNSTWALMWATHKGEYDFYFLGGLKQRRRILGFAFSGYIGDAGLRGELKVSDAPQKGLRSWANVFAGPLNRQNKANIQAVLSFDYAFANSFYTHSEIYYNRDGLSDKTSGLYWNQIQRVDMLSPARWSLFQECAYDLSPLLRADVFLMLNPADHSLIWAPSLSWNALANLDIYLIGFLTHGDAFTTFGSMGKAGYLRFKYSF